MVAFQWLDSARRLSGKPETVLGRQQGGRGAETRLCRPSTEPGANAWKLLLTEKIHKARPLPASARLMPGSGLGQSHQPTQTGNRNVGTGGFIYTSLGGEH